jgi:four helix bundle protein
MKKKIERFEDLELWQRAVELAITIYKISDDGRLKNDFGMKDQIRKASSSISNNIAEGFEYNNNRDFIRFLRYAKASAGEVRNQIYIMVNTGYITQELYNEMYNQLINLSKQIANFIKYLKEFEEQKKVVGELK